MMPEPTVGPTPGEEPKSLNDLGKKVPRAKTSGPQGEPGALAYESPVDRAKREPPLNVLGMTFACGIGFTVAAAAVLFFSGYVYMGVNTNFPGHYPSMDRTPLRCCAAVYFLLFAGTIYGVFRLSRVPGWRQVGRWWVLGMLLGAGAGMLLEGICFAATGGS
jgi:hypothetical protein